MSIIITIFAVLSAVALLGLLSLAFAWRLVRIAFFPHPWDYEQTRIEEISKGNFEAGWFTALGGEELYIDSRYGYKLHALWYANGVSTRSVVLAHGFRYSLFGSIKYLKLFYERGFNVLVYDHRYHGKSGGPCCSMGYYESRDLSTMVDFVLSRIGEGTIVGTHGESMGAATALLHGASDQRVSFIIADCPFGRAWEQFRHRIKTDYHLPAWPVLPLADWITARRVGVRFSCINPEDAIPKISCPVLFVHGDEDRYVPKDGTLAMHAAKTGAKRLYLAVGAEHARSLSVDRTRYAAELEAFLAEALGQ
jgi:hypothetical protein